MFGSGETDKQDAPDVAKLHAKIGELTMECDFLSGGRVLSWRLSNTLDAQARR